MKKKVLSLFLACAMMLSMAIPALADGPTAADYGVASDSWYYNAAQYVIENGYMGSVSSSQNEFAGEATVSRAIVFQTLYNLQGAPDVEDAASFPDVEGTWYATSAAWAEQNGLTETGNDADAEGNFEGERVATRAELATIIANYAVAFEYDVTTAGEGVEAMADYDSVPDWAKEGMATCYYSNIISGKPGSLLDPNGSLTRAELAVILRNLIDPPTEEAADETPATESEASDTLEGEITEIEKYGHAVTTIAIEDMPFDFGDMLTVTFDNGFTVDAPYLPDYFVDQGGYLVRGYQGHTYVGVCINYGKLNEVADIDVGNTVTLTLKEKDGYLAEYEMFQLERTNVRDDYTTDEEFANFRPIVMGDIAEGMLYRSSSPINPELGRAAYASALAADAGIATFINLADSEENIAAHVAGEEFDSPYYMSVYDKGNVICLDMPVAYTSEEFRTKLGRGLAFMSEHEGPFLVHCNEGKDRAGFTSALLEALMGASIDEIRDDYMMSYINYFGLEKGSDKYELIQGANIDVMLCTIAGLEKGSDLSAVDLAQVANDYILSCGVTQSQIDAIVAALSGN